MMQEGLVEVKSLVSHTRPLKETETAIRELKDRIDNPMNVNTNNNSIQSGLFLLYANEINNSPIIKKNGQAKVRVIVVGCHSLT